MAGFIAGGYASGQAKLGPTGMMALMIGIALILALILLKVLLKIFNTYAQLLDTALLLI